MPTHHKAAIEFGAVKFVDAPCRVYPFKSNSKYSSMSVIKLNPSLEK